MSESTESPESPEPTELPQSPNKAQAIALYNVRKFDLAEMALRRALAEEPNNAGLHALLANTLIELKKPDKALVEAQLTVRCAPDVSVGYFVLSTALANLRRYDEGENAIKQALRIEPTDSTYLARASFFAAYRNNWAESLKFAEQGLASDPDDVDCINRRAAALVRLGRHADCEESLKRALQLNPGNGYTHANFGWTLVLQGRSGEAVDYFKEALRLDPNSKWAYEGVLEAMKSRNPLYRFLLSISLGFKDRSLLGRMWVFLMCIINPWLWIVLYFLLVWELFIRTLFTALLRLDPFGRRVLSDETKNMNNGYIFLCIALMLGPVIFIAGIYAVVSKMDLEEKRPAMSTTRTSPPKPSKSTTSETGTDSGIETGTETGTER